VQDKNLSLIFTGPHDISAREADNGQQKTQRRRTSHVTTCGVNLTDRGIGSLEPHSAT
jgi:hypothetical protein